MLAFQPALSQQWLSVSENLRLPSGVTLDMDLPGLSSSNANLHRRGVEQSECPT